MSECAVCVAAEHASEESLRTLVRRQAVMLHRARARLDTFALAAANARVRELEETITRLNGTRPQAAAVEVCRKLAPCDMRDENGRCSMCGESKHRPDCAWVMATVVAKRAGKQDTQTVVDRWTGRSA